MKLKLKSVLAGVASLAVAGSLIVTGAGAAQAAATPFSSTTDVDAVGTLTFYDASGAQISGGLVTDSPLAAYYKASGAKISGTDGLGSVAYATPQDGVLPAGWSSVEGWTSTQNFSTSQGSYPTGLNAAASNVVVKGSATDGGFANHIFAFPSSNVQTPNNNVYQVRLYTDSGTAGGYYAADILVSGSTWSQIYPVLPAAENTTTSLTVKVGGVAATQSVLGDTVSLTAHVAGATTTPSNGSVAFYDGATPVGSTQAFTGSDVTITTSALTVATHSLTAKYIPSGIAYNGSTSSPAASFVVHPVKINTTTTVATSGGVNAYDNVTLTRGSA